jgi:hypothetical protein
MSEEKLHFEDEPGKIASYAHQLWSNEKSWSDEQAKGFQILKQEYSKTANQTLLTHTIESLKARLTERRKENWQGAMLRLNMNRSTKFMSKWIEAKNRLTAR